MSTPGLTVLDRYLLRELTAPFGLGTALFTFFLIIDRIYHLTDLVVTKGVPFHLVVQLLVFILPSFLAHTLPMAFLVAVLLAGGRLAGDMEVVAFKASGISVVRLFRPVMMAGVAVMLVTAGLTLVANPIANREFQRQLFRILETRAVAGLKERVFNTAFGGVTVYVEELSASEVGLNGLLVSDERDPRLSRIITAREGRLLSDAQNRRITLRLLDGALNEADVVPAGPPPPSPGEPVPEGGAAGAGRYRYALFSLYDMTLTLESPLATAQRGEKPEKDLDTPELLRQMDAPGRDPRARLAMLAEWHKRLALPVAALVFALVGFPLAVRSHRGGRSIALVASLVILVAYYLVLTSLEGAALKGRLPVAVAIWLPNAFFGGVGVALLLATARERRWWRWPAFWRLVTAAQERVRQRLQQRPTLRWGRRYVEARDSTHIIDRYLLGQFVTFTGLALTVAVALFILIDLLQTLDRFLRLKPPLIYILEHFAYRMPAEIFKALPIVMLVATIFLFLTLSRSHELTALKAAGISLYRVSAPILVLGLVVSVGAGIFGELVLPRLNELGDEVDRVKIRGELPRHLRTRTRLWLRSTDTRFYRVELLAPGTNDMYGVTVLELDRTFRLEGRLDARLAHWTPAGWELNDGAYREISRDGLVQTVAFTRTALELPERIEDFTQVQKPVSAMGYAELREYVARLEATGFQVTKYLVDLYAKISSPLENLIMVLIAIPFAIQAPRTGRIFGIALAIGIMAVYLLLDRVALAFARADLLPALLAAWTANIIFLGIGGALFLRSRT